jgi:Tol biopolymer transport system component
MTCARTIRRGGIAGAVLLLLLAGPLAHDADAQYFGRNKVQYREFDFRILRTEYFDVYYYPEAADEAVRAARLAERWYSRLSEVLGHRLSSRQPLVLYAAHPHFQQTNTTPTQIGEGTGGFTESLRRRIVLPLAGPLADTDHVIGHELVHAFQFDMTSTRETGGTGVVTGAQRLPLWFVEGMAEYLSIGPVDPHTAMWMRDAVREETLPTLRQLNSPEYFPYRWGHAFWAYVAGRWGDGVVGDLLRQAGASGSPEVAIRSVLKVTPEELATAWHAALRAAYQPLSEQTEAAEARARPLIMEARLGGDLNVGPALSPDGRWLAFLSERGLFSIDLFIADTATGRVVRRVTSTALDPHGSSLQFIASSGAWDSESRRLAFAVLSEGRPALRVVDAMSEQMEREVPLDTLDEVFTPTWAPDGRSLAFTAMTGGVLDLFVYDLTGGTLRRLTQDAYAELQPAWAPDGRRIAFATDRFTTTLPTLQSGAYRLAMIDLETGAVAPVRGFDAGKHLNPQWAPDGGNLYFLSDQDGITNVYRVGLENGAIDRVTNLFTGVTGITASSPALSSATRTDRVAFTVYERGRYRIHAMTTADFIGGDAEAASSGAPAALPPSDRADDRLVTLLNDPALGLPDGSAFEMEGYRARLGLDFVGQPSVAVGVDRFGSFAGGGVSFSFSDMLGNHNLTAAIQAGSNFTGGFSGADIGGLVAYQNLTRRWNWGVVADQIPYWTGTARSSLGRVGNELVVIEQETFFRQTSRAAAGIVAYPFSRAQRVEFQSGVRSLLFDERVRTTTYSLRTGLPLQQDTVSRRLPGTLTLAELSAALVYDTAIVGPVSPLAGQRYRLEASPTAGSLTYSGVLADYRRYVMPAQFYTVAGRLLHVGRYGADGEDRRLTPLFLGYPSLVRGYDPGSFDAGECDADEAGACTVFDRLLGSRIAVGNLEFRFPLLRPFGVRPQLYGPIPVEVALFVDAGVAWDSGTRPESFGRNGRPVASIGTAFRVNAFGFAIVELDLVKPLQRPQQGWMWQFSLSPGF